MKPSTDTTILLPDGTQARSERRANGPYRPYDKEDGTPKDRPAARKKDRRKKKRRPSRCGQIIDVRR